jgi:hypothetical protein
MTTTERDRSSCGVSLKSGVSATFAERRISSGGGVCGSIGSTHIFLLAGSSGLAPSSVGVERFRETGEMGAMTASVMVEFAVQLDAIDEIVSL